MNPTPREDREAKLEYAFSSLLLIPQIFHFTRVKDSLNWLQGLKKRYIHNEILGLYVTKENVYIWVQLSRDVQCCGIGVRQHCKIWCESNTDNTPGFDFCVRKIHEHSQK